MATEKQAIYAEISSALTQCFNAQKLLSEKPLTPGGQLTLDLVNASIGSLEASRNASETM